jgi:hypothetical protein
MKKMTVIYITSRLIAKAEPKAVKVNPKRGDSEKRLRLLPPLTSELPEAA